MREMITFYIIQLLLLFSTLILLIFFHSRKVRAVFYNSIPSILIVFHYIAEDFLHIDDPANIFFLAGIFFYPSFFSMLIADYFPVNRRDFLGAVIIAPFIALSFSIISGVSPETVIIYHLIIYAFLIFKLKDKLFFYLNISLLILSMPMVVALSYFLFRDMRFLSSLLIVLNIIIIFMFLYEYSKKIKILNERITGLNLANKRMEQNINRLRQSNEQLMKIISQKDTELFQLARHASLAEITTGIAHELSQPLTGIKCIAQSIIDDINYDEIDMLQTVSDLTKISSLVDRSSLIIEHIRSFSRRRGFVFKPIDINSCVIGAVDLIKNQLRNSETEIELQLEERLPSINGDGLALEQLVINFIINARDAIAIKRESMPSLHGLISVKTFADGENVVVEISDNGCGIAPDIMKKIWSPFFTTKKGAKGTGIGLSLCQRIIREHNGEVSVKSTEEGTKFTIRFKG